MRYVEQPVLRIVLLENAILIELLVVAAGMKVSQ